MRRLLNEHIDEARKMRIANEDHHRDESLAAQSTYWLEGTSGE